MTLTASTTPNGKTDLDGLERARDVVVNVLLADGLAIALSGYSLSRTGYTMHLIDAQLAQGVAFALLVVLVFASIATRRLFAARFRLRDPSRRAGRLVRAHAASALVGAVAIPLGYVYARHFLGSDQASVLAGSIGAPLRWVVSAETIRAVFSRNYLPTLLGVAPFWIVALAMGLLALPRSSVVEGLGRRR